MKHDFITRETCDCDKSEYNCPVCEGGLSICKVCHGAEGGITTDCPGELATMDQHDAVYAGKLDYRKGEGWVPKHNPTNQTWERVERICKARDNGLRCYGLYEACEDCAGCEDREECKADSRQEAEDTKEHTGGEKDPNDRPFICRACKDRQACDSSQATQCADKVAWALTGVTL